MAVKSDILGPGNLKFGATGSEIEFAAGVREFKITFDTDDGDAIPVLSGDEIDAEETDTFALEGTILQSYDLTSLILWSHINAGQIVPFEFRPDVDKPLGWRGQCKVRRIEVGGEVKTRAKSDFEFPGRGAAPKPFDFAGATPTEITSYGPADAVTVPAEGVDPESPEWE